MDNQVRCSRLKFLGADLHAFQTKYREGFCNESGFIGIEGKYTDEKLSNYYSPNNKCRYPGLYFIGERNAHNFESFVMTRFEDSISLILSNVYCDRARSLLNGEVDAESCCIFVGVCKRIADDGFKKIKAEYRALFTDKYAALIENDLMPVLSHLMSILRKFDVGLRLQAAIDDEMQTPGGEASRREGQFQSTALETVVGGQRPEFDALVPAPVQVAANAGM